MDIYSKFKRDLFNLYVKTKESSIEDVFLRFSQIKDFISWFRGNKRLIKSKVSNQSICDAIDVLIDLRGMTYADDPSLMSAASLSDLVKKFQESSQNLQTIPIIKIFSHFVDDSRFSKILGGFKENIVFISKYFKDPESIDQNIQKIEQGKMQVAEDLNVINSLYVALEIPDKPYVRKPSVAQQRKDMFSYLLSRFVSDVSLAFEKAGRDDIANDIKSKNILTSAAALGDIFNLSPLNYAEINTVKMIVEDVWKKHSVRFSGYNYDLIQLTFLNKAGEISDEDYFSIKAQHSRDEDLSELVDETKEIKMDTMGKITLDAKVNPKYLQMLVLFFNYYRIKLKI